MSTAQDAAPRPLLVFAHANGFPAGSYRVLLDMLRGSFEVLAPEILAHDPRFAVSDGWPQLLRELDAFVAAHRAGREVVLVGHSLGGLLGLMLAAQRPPRLRALVLLDAPLIAGWRALLLWMGKRSGLIRRYAPVAPALRRRQHWPDLDAVRQHLGGKAPFAGWDPRMLDDYARAGTIEGDGGRMLRFRRDIEAEIYATLPHHLGRLDLPQPGLPVGFIGGERSREVEMAGMAATRRLVGAHLRWIAGGSHLFPFEQPQATAQAIIDLLQAMGAAGA